MTPAAELSYIRNLLPGKTIARLAGVGALTAALTGCVLGRGSSSRKYVPPAPTPSVSQPPAPAPELRPSLDLAAASENAAAAEANLARRLAEILANQAEAHFQTGRRLYQDGDEKAARVEFDRAIDLLLTVPEALASRMVTDRKLDQLTQAIHRLDLDGLDTASLEEPSFERPPLEDLPPLTFPVDPKLKNKVLEELKATSSQLPLQVNETVLSYINYFSTERGRRVLLYGMRRAGRYRPMIQRILGEEGVPQELIFLAQAESGFLPRAVSRARAVGMWQFVKSRGREYGLKQSSYVDDRLDPERATRAAARHLHDLYERYGDWHLAIAAYNCGPVNVDRAVARTGYADFWELRKLNVIPKETSNYVPIILAMTIMAKNAREYGLENIDPDPPLVYDTVELTANTHLQLVADLADSSMAQLRELNPALLKNVAPEEWRLRIPKGSGAALRTALEAIPANRRAVWRAHRVVEGDTLASIAKRYRVTERALAAANANLSAELLPGTVVLAPVALTEGSAKPLRRTVRRRSGAAQRRKTAASGAKTSRTSSRPR